MSTTSRSISSSPSARVPRTVVRMASASSGVRARPSIIRLRGAELMRTSLPGKRSRITVCSSPTLCWTRICRLRMGAPASSRAKRRVVPVETPKTMIVPGVETCTSATSGSATKTASAGVVSRSSSASPTSIRNRSCAAAGPAANSVTAASMTTRRGGLIARLHRRCRAAPGPSAAPSSPRRGSPRPVAGRARLPSRRWRGRARRRSRHRRRRRGASAG